MQLNRFHQKVAEKLRHFLRSAVRSEILTKVKRLATAIAADEHKVSLFEAEGGAPMT